MDIKKKPLIFDGAMGTYYNLVSKNPSTKCEFGNIYDRETILNIHKEYIEAGCEAIRTNTFGANKEALESDFNTVKKVITEAYDIALEAVKGASKGTSVSIFADIGPIKDLEGDELFHEYQEIVDLFLDLGAENFIFETFSQEECLIDICRYIKGKNSKAFILVEFSVSPEGYTRLGNSGKKLLEKLSKVSEIDGLGFNCFSGSYHLLQYIKGFNIEDKIISIMPNSGYPTIINNRTFFDNSKEYFGNQMLEIARLGVSILGGCCGTTPDYIKEMVLKLKELNLEDIVYDKKPKKTEVKKSQAENLLINKINKGEKIIAVELDPPIDTEIEFFMESAKKLKNQGVNAITIADCPIARARVDSSILACKLKRELDITPIPHMTCRDRNINATKALLLGLNIEGVNNVLVVTGDPIPSAERNEVKGVFSFNSSILANYITNLNETTFKSPFNICGALNVNAKNFNAQLNQAKKKIENGITMFLTQPVLTKEALENLKLARKELNGKILGGIIPIVSYRNACFMNNEISGINVSEEIIERYEDVSKEEATNLAIEISTKIAKEISPYVDGYYLITPFKRIDIISEIIDNIKSN